MISRWPLMPLMIAKIWTTTMASATIGAKIATRQPRNDPSTDRHYLEGDPEDQLSYEQDDAVLGVPLHFAVLFLDNEWDERQQPQVRQQDHYVAIARWSGAPRGRVGH